MLIVLVEFQTLPLTRDIAMAALLEEVESIRHLPGNLAFNPLISADNSSSITLIQEWKQATDFDAYKQSTIFDRVRALLGKYMMGAPSSRSFEIDLAPV